MNKKNNQKLLIVLFCAFSLFSFLYVNIHHEMGRVDNTMISMGVMKVESQEEQNSKRITVPSLSVIEKVLSVIERFVPGN